MSNHATLFERTGFSLKYSLLFSVLCKFDFLWFCICPVLFNVDVLISPRSADSNKTLWAHYTSELLIHDSTSLSLQNMWSSRRQTTFSLCKLCLYLFVLDEKACLRNTCSRQASFSFFTYTSAHQRTQMKFVLEKKVGFFNTCLCNTCSSRR